MNPCTNKSIGQLIGLHEFGALDEPELQLFKAHLIECEYCFNEVYTLEVFGTAFRTHREREKRATGVKQAERSSRWSLRSIVSAVWLRPAAAAAALLVVISVLAAGYISGWLRPGHSGGSNHGSSGSLAINPTPAPFDDLQIAKAAYKPPRNGVILRTPKKDFERAMAAYKADEFSRAIEILQPLSDLDPDVASEAKFYLGVSLLMVGRSQDAILPLKQALNLQDETERENTLYYLALAYLKTNQPREALPELEAVVQANGAHSQEAQRLIQRVHEIRY